MKFDKIINGMQTALNISQIKPSIHTIQNR